MRKISYSKSPANVHACADSRRDFWTTNWKSTVGAHQTACVDLAKGIAKMAGSKMAMIASQRLASKAAAYHEICSI